MRRGRLDIGANDAFSRAASPSPSKGTVVFVLISFIIVAVASIVALVSEVRRDGYRQLPERNLVRAF